MEDLDLQVAYVRRWRLLKSEISPCALLSRDDILSVITSVAEGSLRVGRDDNGEPIYFDYYLVVREIIVIFAAE